MIFFFFQAEDGIRDLTVTGVQTCALPILYWLTQSSAFRGRWRESIEHLRRATELALRAEAKEVVAGYTADQALRDRKSTRLNSSHSQISYAVFCLKKKKKKLQSECVCIQA